VSESEIDTAFDPSEPPHGGDDLTSRRRENWGKKDKGGTPAVELSATAVMGFAGVWSVAVFRQ
jgi:hypothetical protein